MGDVVRLKRRRKEGLRGAIRRQATDALGSVGAIRAAVIVVLGADGRFAIRSIGYEEDPTFDIYSRVGAIIEKRRLSLIDEDDVVVE